MADNTVSFNFEYNGQNVRLPINPEALPVTHPGGNDSADVVGLGEVTIIKPQKLGGIELQGFLPYANDGRPSIMTTTDFKPPEFYFSFFSNIRNAKKPVRLVVTGIKGIAGLFTIENFEYKHAAASPDVEYTLSIKEYRAYGAQRYIPQTKNGKTTAKASTKQPAKRANTAGAITVGAEVIVNGQLHRDSFGAGPGQTKTNYHGKINFIKKERAFPYHVTTPTGDWLGWVTKSAVRLA